jgi:cytochrome b561
MTGAVFLRHSRLLHGLILALDVRQRWPLAGRTHRNLRWAVYVFVSLHTAAALGHHFMLKDNVLRRMLPKLPKRSLANYQRRDCAPCQRIAT